MANHSQLVSFIWSVADLIRNSFSRGHYQDVILPMTVLRRIDLVLAPTKPDVLAAHAKLSGKLDNLDPQLRRASGLAFYNTSRFDFETLLDEPAHLAKNFKAYIAGFSPNMRDVIEKLDFENTIDKLETAGLLFKVVQRFADNSRADLSPESLSNHEMGTVFEELTRKFNESLDQNPGEHFTPREVIRLMATLVTCHDRATIADGRPVRTVYDPCCGSGGMLTIAKDQILDINPDAQVHLFGQEVNPQTYAMCKSDLYIKGDGRDADNIAFGSTLSNDQHADRRFDYLMANPPYGYDWSLDQDAVRREAARAAGNRFDAGLPRISDGQLLFLLHMVARMHPAAAADDDADTAKDAEAPVSRVAIIMNGSPLFTGDAKSGESEIRRWVIETDTLEAIVALPQQLFYNTGISTYVWILSNRKPADRRGRIALIDATEAWLPRSKSLGAKRRDIPDGIERPENYLPTILRAYEDFVDQDLDLPAPANRVGGDAEPSALGRIRTKIFDGRQFGFRKVTIERPLRLNFEASEERIARLPSARAFANLATSRKKDDAKRREEIEAGERTQAAILKRLHAFPPGRTTKRDQLIDVIKQMADEVTGETGVKISPSVRRAILESLSERDPDAPACRDKYGDIEPDPTLRDTESVPLTYLDDEGVADDRKVDEYFEREVKPHVDDAWINREVTDERDGHVGAVGYEINFNRHFYVYRPPRPLQEIEADIKAVEQDVLKLLAEVTG